MGGESLSGAALQAQVIDLATLERLISDLREYAGVRTVLVKHGSRTHAASAALPLEEACAQLLRGEVRGFQAQYRWEGEEWLDTVLAAQGGWRIVRIKVAAPP